MELDIENNKKESRFEAYVDGLLVEVQYIENDDCLVVTGTHVPKALEGKGIAGMITKFVLDYAEENSMKIEPVCSYTKVYIERHPEYKNLLKV